MDLLAGTRVVSFNHFLVGPTGAQILGDLGADVIAVEPLGIVISASEPNNGGVSDVSALGTH